MRYCWQCNAELPDDSLFCLACGTSLSEAQTAIPEDTIAAKNKPHHKKWFAFAVICGILLLLVAAVVLIIPHDKSISFSDNPTAITAASRSVVLLNCYDKFDRLISTGSGFAFFEDDVILTNYHVIDGDVYSIKATTEEDKSFGISSVLAYDKEKDIAILQTDMDTGLSVLQPGDSENLQKGEKVVAIGSPLGLINSVSTGVFSGYVPETNMDVLQFTASISSGSSGGALFNDKGEVLGITYASYDSGQNLNLAVPIEEALALWNDRTENDKQSIDDFYNDNPHIYTVDYVIANYDQLLRETLFVEGWVFSHGSNWCTVYESTAVFDETVDSRSLSADEQIQNYKRISIFLELPPTQNTSPDFMFMNTGDHIRAMVVIDEVKSQTGHITLTVKDIQTLTE